MKEHIRIVVFLLIITITAYSCHQAVISITESKLAVTEKPNSISLDVSFLRTIDLVDKKIHSVSAADFNNDGYDDIVAGVFAGRSMIFINNKDETFSKIYFTGKDYYTEVVKAIDIDKDGNKDVILGNSQQPIAIFRNNGDETFSLLKEFDRTVVKDIAVADFDNNGYEDFVIGTQAKENFIYFNDHAELMKVKYSENLPVESVAAGDLNNDGLIDFAAGIGRRPTRIYINNGNQSFSLSKEIGKVPNTESVAIGDMNKDGRNDIMQGNNRESNLLILNTEAGFEAKPEFGAGNTYVILNADLDNDDNDEVIVGNYEGTIQIYKKYNEEYELVKEIKPIFKNYVRDLAVGDFNKDGKLDLVAAREREMTQIYIS